MANPEIYSPEYYQRLYELENRHWWHTGMREIAAALLRSQQCDGRFGRVLDAGCGTGATMTWVRDRLGARAATGVDISREAIHLCRARDGQARSQASVLALPFRSDFFDLILCWDVLQHLPTDGSDVSALVEMGRVLRPGGLLLLRANSRLGMWQDDQERDPDFQRYTLAEVVARLEAAGLCVERATYANALPAVYASARRWAPRRSRRSEKALRLYEGLGVRDTPTRSSVLNRLLFWVLKAEARYLAAPGRSLAFGHSTLCLARKPAAVGVARPNGWRPEPVPGLWGGRRKMTVLPEGAREVRKPALSVVIASVNGYHYISQCLCSLERQHARELAEVIVVECSGDDTARRIADEYPWARILPVPTPQPIPTLRSLGMRQARAEIVVTTEDHCLFDEHWYERILQAHQEHHQAAIGGAVENGSRRLVDWGVYVCEYGKFMLPFAAGAAADLPGPNVSYKREVLEETCGDLLDRGVWENVLHERLLSSGKDLRVDPSIVVYHAKEFGFLDFLTQRYYFGRSFAAVRVERAPLSRRVFFVGISLLLPPLFLVRYARYFFGKRRFIREFFQTLPLLVVFAAAWSVGEFFGYAFGDGGASLRVK